MIKAKATAPALFPKSKPEDQQKLKEFYHFVDERLVGIEDAMKKYGIDKLVISFGEDQSDATAATAGEEVEE